MEESCIASPSMASVMLTCDPAATAGKASVAATGRAVTTVPGATAAATFEFLSVARPSQWENASVVRGVVV